MSSSFLLAVVRQATALVGTAAVMVSMHSCGLPASNPAPRSERPLARIKEGTSSELHEGQANSSRIGAPVCCAMTTNGAVALAEYVTENSTVGVSARSLHLVVVNADGKLVLDESREMTRGGVNGPFTPMARGIFTLRDKHVVFRLQDESAFVAGSPLAEYWVVVDLAGNDAPSEIRPTQRDQEIGGGKKLRWLYDARGVQGTSLVLLYWLVEFPGHVMGARFELRDLSLELLWDSEDVSRFDAVRGHGRDFGAVVTHLQTDGHRELLVGSNRRFDILDLGRQSYESYYVSDDGSGGVTVTRTAH